MAKISKRKKRRKSAPLRKSAQKKTESLTKIQVVHYVKEIQEMNKLHIDKFLPIWKEQAEANRPYWENGSSMDELIKNTKPFENKHAAVCAAGPSLANSMPDLQKHRDDITIITIDSAVFPLKLIGVFPDYIFVKNHTDITVELLKNYPTEKSSFILPVSACPELVKQIKGKMYFYVPSDHNDDLKTWMKEFPPHLSRFILKPSTGSMAAVFATLLKFSSITLLGFDFAYTAGKLYCDLVKYPALAQYREDHNETTDPGLVPFRVKDVYRDWVYTSKNLQMSAEDLFRYVMLNEFENVYTASDGILYNIPWLPLRYAIVGISEFAKSMGKFSVDALVSEEVRQINEMTTNTFMGLMSRNMIYNKEAGLVTNYVTELFKLKDKFANMVAIVAGASPSLDDCLDDMIKHRDKYFLVGVDATVNPLLKAGLKPDIVISVDPQRSVDEFFKGVDTRDIPLMATIVSHPEAMRLWQGPILWGWGLNPHKHFLKLATIFPDMPTILPQGNCGSTAIIFLQSIGFKNIILAGVDFAFSNDRYYCKNVLKSAVSLEGKEKLRENRLRAGRKVIEVTDIRGNQVLTDDTFTSYATVLNHKIQDDHNWKIVNYYNAGAGIVDAAQVIDLDTFFSR